MTFAMYVLGVHLELQTGLEISTAMPEEKYVELACSSSFTITMSTAARNKAGVPPLAHSGRFVHSIAQRSIEQWVAKLPSAQLKTPGLSMLLNGGFLWLDMNEVVVGISEIVRSSERILMEFEAPVELPFYATYALKHRWIEVSSEMKRTLKCGAHCFYAWISPGELILGRRYARFGGVAFLFYKGASWDLLSGASHDCASSSRSKSSIPVVTLFSVSASHI